MPAAAPMAKLDHAAKAEITNRSPAEQRLFKRIVCMCDTCPRLPLSECGCGFAEKERARITRMLTVEHKSEAEVIAWFMEKYGQAALGAPVEGLGRWAWLFRGRAALAARRGHRRAGRPRGLPVRPRRRWRRHPLRGEAR